MEEEPSTQPAMKMRKEGEESRPWADLLQDILRLIVERLYLVDRIRFRTVCKEWLLASIHDLQPIHKLPWIMTCRFTSSSPSTVCSLYEPYQAKPYVITEDKNIVGAEGDSTRRTRTYFATACASRCGWVLFSRILECFSQWTTDHKIYSVCITSYSVYNVLTKETIALPNLKAPQHQRYCNVSLATFSSLPTSPDCVFFVPHQSTTNQILFSTYSIGDETWKTYSFTCPHAWRYEVQDVVYMEGSFYCLSKSGLLASFNIATQEWRPLMSIMWDMPLGWGRGFILEYGGSLIILFTRKKKICERDFIIYRFDWLDRVWIKMESLEGGAIFFRKPAFGVSAGEGTKMVANMVCYFCMNRPWCSTYGPAVSQGIQSVPLDTSLYHAPPDPCYSNGSKFWMDPPLLNSSLGEVNESRVGFRFHHISRLNKLF